MAEVAQIVTKLKLDGKEFNKGISKTTGGILKLAASGLAIQVAMKAAAIATAGYQDDMIKAARVAGTTSESYSKMALAVEQGGVDLNFFGKSLGKLASPIGKTETALKELGVSTKDANGNLRDTTETFKDIANKVSKIENPADKARIAIDIFGQSGAKLVNVLNNGADGLEKFAQKATRLGIVVSTEAGEAAEKFNDRMSDLSKSLQGVVNAVGESIIEFENQNSMMDILTDTLTDVTKFWRDLDKETKQYIISAVSIATAVTALLGVLTGLILIAPAVGAAITVMMGPIGLIIVAIGLLISAAVALVNHFGNIERSAAKLSAELAKKEDLKARAVAIQGIATAEGNLISKVDDLNTGSKKLLQTNKFLTLEASSQVRIATALLNIDKQKNKEAKIAAINAEIAKTATFLNMFAAGQASKQRSIDLQKERSVRAGTASQRKYALSQIKKFEKELIDLKSFEAKQTKELLILTDKLKLEMWGVTVPTMVLGTALKTALTPMDKLKREFVELLKMMEKALEGINSQTFETELEKLVNNFQNAITSVEKVIAGANIVEFFANQAKQIVGIVSDFGDIAVADIQRTTDIMNRNFEVRLNDLKKAQETETALFEENRDTRLSEIENAFQNEIDALQRSEDKKLAVMERGAAQRLLALDEEFAKIKELEEAKFQDFLERQERKFEIDKENILEKAADEEQRKLDEALLDEDFRLFVENEDSKHQQNLSQLEKDFLLKRRKQDDIDKDKQRKAQKTSDDAIIALEKKRDDALLTAQDNFANSFLDLQDKQSAEQAKITKENVKKNWLAEKEQFNQTKTIKKIEIAVNSAAAAAAILAQQVAAFGLFGFASGGILAAAIIGLGAKRIDQVDAMKPLKPAALLGGGGVLLGPSHDGGGIPVIAEGREGFLDKVRTDKFIAAADNAIAGTRTVVINIAEGAIVMTGIEGEFTEDFLDNLGEALRERIDREGSIVDIG